MDFFLKNYISGNAELSPHGNNWQVLKNSYTLLHVAGVFWVIIGDLLLLFILVVPA